MHGGDIYSNKIEYDFSVNLNPFGPYEEITEAVKDAVNRLNTYPEYGSKTLCSKLAEVYETDPENLCITNGASEAFMAVISALLKNNALIEIPSFSGYEYCVKSNQNCNVNYINRDKLVNINTKDIEEESLVFIANPSNPSGLYLDTGTVDRLYSVVKEKRSYLILDECFLPLTEYENQSFIYKANKAKDYYSNLIVVRSFTKSFSIPGLRLGYLFCTNSEAVERIKVKIPEWSVSVPAQAAGIAAINNISRLKEDIKKIGIERKYLVSKLKELGLDVLNSDSCFLLFTGHNELYDKLIERKILIRDCEDYRGIHIVKEKISGYKNNKDELKVYRTAVKKHEENEILISEIKKCIRSSLGVINGK